MKTISNRTCEIRFAKAVMSLALGVILIMAVTGLAHADEPRDQGRHDSGRHRGHDRDWRRHEGGVYLSEPGYVYAPPVIYAPPPVYEAPGINLIIPLNIR